MHSCVNWDLRVLLSVLLPTRGRKRAGTDSARWVRLGGRSGGRGGVGPAALEAPEKWPPAAPPKRNCPSVSLKHNDGLGPVSQHARQGGQQVLLLHFGPARPAETGKESVLPLVLSFGNYPEANLLPVTAAPNKKPQLWQIKKGTTTEEVSHTCQTQPGRPTGFEG